MHIMYLCERAYHYDTVATVKHKCQYKVRLVMLDKTESKRSE